MNLGNSGLGVGTSLSGVPNMHSSLKPELEPPVTRMFPESTVNELRARIEVLTLSIEEATNAVMFHRKTAKDLLDGNMSLMDKFSSSRKEWADKTLEYEKRISGLEELASKTKNETEAVEMLNKRQLSSLFSDNRALREVVTTLKQDRLREQEGYERDRFDLSALSSRKSELIERYEQKVRFLEQALATPKFVPSELLGKPKEVSKISPSLLLRIWWLICTFLSFFGFGQKLKREKTMKQPQNNQDLHPVHDGPFEPFTEAEFQKGYEGNLIGNSSLASLNAKIANELLEERKKKWMDELVNWEK